METNSSNAKRPWFALTLFAGLLALALIPSEWIEQSPRICVFHAITGNDCPGCGITRAGSHLLHGDLETALQLNWRIAVVLPILIGVGIRDVFALSNSRKRKQRP